MPPNKYLFKKIYHKFIFDSFFSNFKSTQLEIVKYNIRLKTILVYIISMDTIYKIINYLKVNFLCQNI